MKLRDLCPLIDAILGTSIIIGAAGIATFGLVMAILMYTGATICS